MHVKRSITRLLVANRGEIARRIFRSCRSLGISTVAVFSEPDASGSYVREADLAFALGGYAPGESYLRAELMIEAAVRTGADAVHPGYGFLSENAEFAEQVLAAGLIWIGPSPKTIRAMGSKVQARNRLQEAGVPVLPGRELGSATDPPVLLALAEEIGYPLLAKASAGGGGKGMRIVHEPECLVPSIEAARREAQGAFGDDTVFLERYVEKPRHVEIQIFGDAYGHVVSLFERECSIQRRHQKVIEEAPSPAVDDQLRQRMSEVAVAAGDELGYVGAGTVEFLLTAEREFFFLEVNTRLQVEHAVTELVTGLDLVELQLRVAMGEPLPVHARHAQLQGHAIEVRLYAEDPRQSFLPVTGTIRRFAIPAGVRVDTGVEDGTAISPHYDPMIAKVIAHGADRDEATRRLRTALAASEIHGVTTNRDLLVGVLGHAEFAAGRTDTHFLERHDPAALGASPLDANAQRRYAAAAALAIQAFNRAHAEVLRTIPSGWRNNPSQPAATGLSEAGDELRVRYRFARDGTLCELTVDDREFATARLHACSSKAVDLELGGVRCNYRVRIWPDGPVFVNAADGQADFGLLPRFPSAGEDLAQGSLASPLPGIVIRVIETPGAEVVRGAALVIIEAMKMEHEIVAPTDGLVTEMNVREGDQVEAGAILAVISESVGA